MHAHRKIIVALKSYGINFDSFLMKLSIIKNEFTSKNIIIVFTNFINTFCLVKGITIFILLQNHETNLVSFFEICQLENMLCVSSHCICTHEISF